MSLLICDCNYGFPIFSSFFSLEKQNDTSVQSILHSLVHSIFYQRIPTRRNLTDDSCAKVDLCILVMSKDMTNDRCVKSRQRIVELGRGARLDGGLADLDAMGATVQCNCQGTKKTVKIAYDKRLISNSTAALGSQLLTKVPVTIPQAKHDKNTNTARNFTNAL